MPTPQNREILERLDALEKILSSRIELASRASQEDRIAPLAVGVTEAARLIDTDREIIYDMIAEGCFGKVARLGKEYRISYKAVQAWVENGGTKRRKVRRAA